DLTLHSLAKNEPDVIEAMAVGFLIGFILGGVYLCFEVFSGQWIRRMAVLFQPWLAPSALHTAVSPAGATLFEPHLLNHGITVLALLFAPALSALKSLTLTARHRLLLLIGLFPAAAAILRSEHATSKLAILAGMGIFWLYRARPALARDLTMVGWSAITLLIVPIAATLYAQKLYAAPWLFPSAQQRIVIWGYTSGQVARA